MMGCELCPCRCGARRKEGQAGACGAKGLRAARAGLHQWEEPCISGKRGSGAVFFSGCPLGCVFCQNYQISHEKEGKDLTASQLARVFARLEEQGAHNINLVSPTPYVEEIIEALELYRPHVPVVYNTSGYERVETLRRIDPYVDIYLPDVKYVSPEISQKYSGVSDYFEVASQALLFMLEQKPQAVFDEDGMMRRGSDSPPSGAAGKSAPDLSAAGLDGGKPPQRDLYQPDGSVFPCRAGRPISRRSTGG